MPERNNERDGFLVGMINNGLSCLKTTSHEGNGPRMAEDEGNKANE